MNGDDTPKPTVEPYLSKEQEAAFERLLPLPPLAANMPVGSVLARRIQYWGLRAVWEAYQQVIMAGTAARQAVKEAYRTDRELQEEQEKWKKSATYREGAGKEADIFLLEVNNRLLHAQLENEQIAVQLKETREKNRTFELQAEIASERRAAEQLRAQRERVEEGKKLEAAQTEEKPLSLADRIRQIEVIIAQHEQLKEERDKLIERYGGEANVPAALLNFLDNLEDEIGLPP